MCGINGYVLSSSTLNFSIEPCINQMNAKISHRGPDDSGVFLSEDNSVALGMQRLSIIDLSAGSQPMYSDNNQIIIVFNGEIYNYKEIRDILKSEFGANFKTNSDTEVILRGYEVWGNAILSHLNGMFAISIYDAKENKLLIARDRTGEKPLYYYPKPDLFAFCSELKSMKIFWEHCSIENPKISKDALNLFLTLTYIPCPYSIYEGVYKLEPGTYIEVDTISLSYHVTKYWNILPLSHENVFDYSIAKNKLKDLVYDSVEKRMISDVPYGAFLSGGVDSSIIVAVMADLKPNDRIKTFSIISSNKKFDESERSYSVSKHCKTDHFPIMLDLNDIVENIDSVILNFDEPFADSSALPAFFVSKKTKEKVTVALTGDGGDEVFGGYNRYLMSYYASIYQSIIPSFLHNKLIKPVVNSLNLRSDDRGTLFKIKKFSNAVSGTEFNNTINIMSLGFGSNTLHDYLSPSWYSDQWKSLFSNNWASVEDLTSLKKARYLDIKISLEGDMLVKVDRVSMQNSLECRSPFLDYKLIDFSFQLPDNFLIGEGKTKKILKDTFESMLPKGLFKLSKNGFGIPVGDWIREYFKDDLMKWTSNDYLLNQGIFNPVKIRQLVADHLQGKSDSTFRVWTFFCFQKWWNAHYSK